MASRPHIGLWMGSAACAALALAAAVLAVKGTGERGIDGALAATARLAFLLFWVAYVGGAAVALFGPAFGVLKRYGRELGLSFAVVEAVHLGLVAWLCAIGAAPDRTTFLFFGGAALFLYAIMLFSIAPLRRAIGPNAWWLLRLVGMNYIAYAFFVDFYRTPLDGGLKHVIQYLPFVTLAVLGPSLRLAAFAKRVDRLLSESPYRMG